MKTLALVCAILIVVVAPLDRAVAADSKSLKELSDLSDKQRKQLIEGKQLVFPLKISGVSGSQAFLYLPYSPEFIYDMMSDCPSFPKWLKRVKAITSVKWETPQVALVGYRVQTPIRTVNYTLRRVHDRPKTIRWSRVSGDLLIVTGGYDFHPEGGGTLMRIYMGMEPAFWVPGFLRGLIAKTGMQELMENIEHEAKRRSARK